MFLLIYLLDLESLIYQALPLVFDAMHEEGYIVVVVVVSPLVSFMKDQVQKLRNLGISAVTLSDIEEEDAKAVELMCLLRRLWKSRGFLKNRKMEETECPQNFCQKYVLFLYSVCIHKGNKLICFQRSFWGFHPHMPYNGNMEYHER